MLVLSRQIDETIMIGNQIEVTIVDIRGDKVRLGITAPKAVAVHRKEVFDAIKKENAAAANSADFSNFTTAMKPDATGRSPQARRAHESNRITTVAEGHGSG